MIIRSQSKKGITNLDNVDTIEVHDCQIRYFCGGVETVGLLGKYSTEEKAIKVLDMIEESYRKSFEEKQHNYVGHRFDLVFEMPQDSEV